MHGLTSDPLYTANCAKVIADYEKCNSSLVNKMTNSCAALYADMTECMHKARMTKRSQNAQKAKGTREYYESVKKELYLD